MIEQIERQMRLKGVHWVDVEKKIDGKQTNALKREILPKLERIEAILGELNLVVVLIDRNLIK